LDYPGVGPEHSFLKDVGRAEYYSVTDEEALEGRTILYLLPCQMYSDISFLFFDFVTFTLYKSSTT